MTIEERDVVINGKVNGVQQIQYPATRWGNIVDAPLAVDGVLLTGDTDMMHYGVCSAAASASSKTVVLEGFKLIAGARIHIKFINSNSASAIWLNVNSTGAKSVYFPGTTSQTTDAYGYIAAGGIYEFVYDGTAWIFTGSSNRLYHPLTLTLNGTAASFYGASALTKSWYAPIVSGSAGQVLKSRGGGSAPEWADMSASRTASVIVAASGADGALKAGADFVCDGTNDEAEIQAAIDSLPSGGHVYLTAGDFYIGGAVMLSKTLYFSGAGDSTVLRRRYDETSAAPGDGIYTAPYNGGLIQCSGQYIEISDLRIDGGSRYSNANTGIKTGYYTRVNRVSFHNHACALNVWNSCSITNCFFSGCAAGVSAAPSECIIADNIFSMSSEAKYAVCFWTTGSYMGEGSVKQIIAAQNAVIGGEYGIQLIGGIHNGLIVNNTIQNTKKTGIYLKASGTADYLRDIVIASNQCFGGENGIELLGIAASKGYSCRNCSIEGNTLRSHTGYGIRVSGAKKTSTSYVDSYCTDMIISDNFCTDNGTANIYLFMTERCLISGNNCIMGSGAAGDYETSQYNIQVGASCSNNLIVGNLIYGKNYSNSGGSTNTFANNKYN